MRELAVKLSQEILPPHIILLHDDDAEFAESPILLALVGVVVFRVPGELFNQRGFGFLRLFDFEEKVIRALVVGEREERVGMDAALEVGLLPVEGQSILFAEAVERDVKEADLELMVERSEGVFIEALGVLGIDNLHTLVCEAVHVGARLHVKLEVPLAVDVPFFAENLQFCKRAAEIIFAREPVLEEFGNVLRAEAEILSEEFKRLSFCPCERCVLDF